MNAPTRPWPLLALLGLYVAARLLFVPDDPAVGGLGHDGAYIARLAENLLAGNGYVNDAHWLVFLKPAALPMPFHNANPLYPTLIAGVSGATGLGVVPAGFAINAVMHGLLILVLVALLKPWVAGLGARSLLAGAVAFFPPLFEDSLAYLPDLTCLVLLLASVACLVRLDGIKSVVFAGVCFGLAWLTRSSATLALPMIGVYLLGRYGVSIGLGRCVVLGVAALVVASPWLVHTHLVWGSPLRSDSGYYWMQDYHARDFDGSVERYWHSPDEPASAGVVLRREPGPFLAFYTQAVPRVVRQAVAEWSGYRLWLAGVLGVLALASVIRLPWTLPVFAAATCVAFSVLLFAPRAWTFEIRYLSLVSVLFALLMLFGLVQALRGWNDERAGLRWANRLLAILGLGFWLAWVPYRNAVAWQRMTTEDPERAAYLDLARDIDDDLAHGDPVVVGQYPYFYTLATKAPSLSIPHSDDAWLIGYMKQYGARFVLLTPAELAFWRPGWAERTPDGFVRHPAGPDGAVVFERKDAP